MEFAWGDFMSDKHHLNYIILSDGQKYYLFEREHKDVPFEAYSKSKCLKIGDSVSEIFGKSNSLKIENDFSENLGKSESKSSESPIDFSENLGISKSKSLGSRIPAVWEIEKDPYEVVFNV